ncbi:protein kinase [bacterium]|nr:protein kinase [bacterium]
MEAHTVSSEPQETESAIQSAAAPVYAVLMMTDISGRAVERDILRETTLIGSGRGCDVRLKSDDIAAAHCILSLDAGQLRLRDLGSRIGTLINGQRVRTAVLTDGDELQLGRHRLRVETNLPGQITSGFYMDKYHVTEVLGSGGMCWIYGARDSFSRERVALKVLPSRHSPRMLTHFGIEARASLRLNHPNLVRIYRIVQLESLYFLVLEYLEAITLQELVEGQGPLPWKQACSLARQLALGLSHVHAQGIIHRDVKPANVLCLRSGQAKLIDFGLSMLAGDPEQERLSKLYQNQILGTADYISPEQSRLSSDVDPRSDLYSLGCTLYYALTGHVVFTQADVRDKIRAHRHQAPVNPQETVPQIPDEVSAIVLRLLAKSRDDRFASGDELAMALEPWSQLHPVEFDWRAVLAIRAAGAHRRLAKLVSRKRPTSETVPQAPVVLAEAEPAAGPTRSGTQRSGQTIEVSLMEYLNEGATHESVDRRQWGELFEVWMHLTAEQRDQVLKLAHVLGRSDNTATDEAH